MFLCHEKPTVHMVSYIFLENLRPDDIFSEAVIRKCQKSSLSPPAEILGEGGTARDASIAAVRDKVITYSSGVWAW